MNARRYVVCGVVSVALHSLALSAQTPPPPQFSMNDADTGTRVAIQLIAAPQPEHEPSPEKIEPKVIETPPVEQPVVKEPVVEKKPALKKPVVKKTDVKKPMVKQPAVKKAPEVKKPIDKKIAPKPKPVEKKPVEKKPLEEKPKEEKQVEKKTNVNKANAQVNQAKNSAPVLVKRPTFKVRPSQPKYPRIAKRKGMEGNVLIEVWLDEDGNQTKQNILQSSGFNELDDAALKAVKKWHFNGYKNDGVALAHRVRIPVRFNLD
ncbi:ferric siderophore ABC transporter substrate-binding protein [Enterovibrio norvegicus]|uniref:energy transducer TonB n=1 Tax=Enterovibrio norvegicus TaxID=188144 RepID=UPI00035F979E|nr:energy transducer TonB [Enterovibrio norvegicus]OEF51682.1 ferric siderophore ABC transporter substrate-binding protein [Enterovibrio norvegicus]